MPPFDHKAQCLGESEASFGSFLQLKAKKYYVAAARAGLKEEVVQISGRRLYRLSVLIFHCARLSTEVPKLSTTSALVDCASHNHLHRSSPTWKARVPARTGPVNKTNLRNGRLSGCPLRNGAHHFNRLGELLGEERTGPQRARTIHVSPIPALPDDVVSAEL